MRPPVQPDRSPMSETATTMPSHATAADSSVPRAAGSLGGSGSAESVSELELQLRLLRVVDVAVVLMVLLIPVFIGTNLGSMPEGIAQFLALRITVKNLLLLSLFALAWRGLCHLTGLYEWEVIRRRRSEIGRVALTCGMASLVALVFPAISATGAFRYEAVGYFWIGGSAAMLAIRSLLRALLVLPGAGAQRTALIVGTGPRAQRLYSDLRSSRSLAYSVVGFVDSDDRRSVRDRSGAILGRLDELESILMHNAIDEVLVALPIKSRYAEIQSALESCQRVGVPAKYCADLFDPIKGRAIHEEGRPSLVMKPHSPDGWRLISKRVIDVGGAVVGLIVLAPVLLIAATAIKLTSAGPVLFTQERYGHNRRLFRMYKLRTMVAEAALLQQSLEERNEASGPVFKIHDDPRITAVGRYLRRFSIDELPQFVNVLRGEMSLVGPRPLPVRDVHRFDQAALMRRFSVRPGLTGLWQIGGRSQLGFDDWIRLDLKYIDEWTLTLDLIVLLKTVPVVMRGDGAS
jgi:exopolysaccharide biosynthesis polyprenyl glycosylphosphotransferase